MKRYKVGEPIKVILDQGENYSNGYIIPAGVEICLEEVKEEKHVHSISYVTSMCDCGYTPIEDIRPKDEVILREIRGILKTPENEDVVKWAKKIMTDYCTKYGDGKCYCGKCDVKDQPLTPKDVGMRKGEAYYEFYDWCEEMFCQLENLSDEEFDRLYQEFLNSYKK
jgi:hypothetical protein